MPLRPRVLVLGGGGFIGSHVADALVAGGHPVRLFGTARHGWSNVAHLADRVERVTGDVADTSATAAAMAGCEIAVYAVGARPPGGSAADPAGTADRDLIPAIRFFSRARAGGLRRLVLVSSGGTIYGRARSLPITEDHPTEPISPYGAIKLATEKFLALISNMDGLGFAVLRFGNLYGERQPSQGGQGAVAAFIGRALAGRPVEMWGDGAVVRDYLHASDGARAVLAVMETAGVDQVFNVGTGIGTSLAELASAVGSAVGRPIEIVRGPPRLVDVPSNVLDASRLSRATGWKPQVTLEEGIRRAAAWLASRPAR